MRTDCLTDDDLEQLMGPTHASNAMSAMNVEYTQMTEALHWQQQRIVELETENRELRRQLDDLRRGVGVSLVIEGRQIPLMSPDAPAMPRHSAGPSARPTPAAPWISGVYPASTPATTAAPAPTPVPMPPPMTPPQPAFPSRPAVQTTAHTMPPQRANTHHGEAAFPENAWLTGPVPAVKPASPSLLQQQQQQPARHTPHQESSRVQQSQHQSHLHRFTPPTWLQEEAPTVASWEAEPKANTPMSNPRTSVQRQHSPKNPIPPIPAEVWRAEQQRDTGRFRTLAQMTGQHPAVRIPGKAKKAGTPHGDEHNPFADSFVLG